MSENSKSLLFDAGNSFLKWAVCDGHRLSHHGVHEYDRELVDFGLSQALEKLGPGFARVLIGSVAGSEIEQALCQLVSKKFSVQAWIQQVDADHDALQIAYVKPSQLGVDRWLAMLGAQSIHNGPVCVADCGTALTLDGVDANGVHLGGVIVPGCRLMQQSLMIQAAKINHASTSLPVSIFADNTGAAVSAGSHYTQAAILDRFVTECEQKLAQKPLVVVTGGGRQSLIEFCFCDVIEVPDLVLIGLALAAGVLH